MVVMMTTVTMMMMKEGVREGQVVKKHYLMGVVTKDVENTFLLFYFIFKVYLNKNVFRKGGGGE